MADVNEFINRGKEDRVTAYAAQASFFLILSVFPFIILILTCIRFLPVTDADLIQVLQYILPSEVKDFIVSIVEELMNRSNNTLLSFSILTAIWSASKGIMSISDGLNSVYRTNESRNYFILRGLAMLHTLIVLVAMILLLVLFVFGNAIYNAIAEQAFVIHNIATLIISIRVVIGFVLLFFMFLAMYRELANHKITIRMAAPGALFSAVSWIAVSFLFSVYINYFSNYSRIYGSLTALAIAMLWIYIMMSLLLWGGEINVYLTRRYPEKFPEPRRRKESKCKNAQKITQK
jgi:membrane protein